jgi:hypothetical protein
MRDLSHFHTPFECGCRGHLINISSIYINFTHIYFIYNSKTINMIFGVIFSCASLLTVTRLRKLKGRWDLGRREGAPCNRHVIGMRPCYIDGVSFD